MSNSNDVFISVGIPFYNASEHLKDSINCILSQTHKNFELILINDGSTDKSLEIALSFKDQRIKVISDGLNKGLATRLNEIVRLARYDIIARMDADDLVLPNRLSVQLDTLLDSNVDLVSCGLCSVNSKLEVQGFRYRNNAPIRAEDLYNCTHGIVHGSVVGRRDWFVRNVYNEALPRAQDYELWNRAYFNKDLRIKVIPDILYVYREDLGISYNNLISACDVSKYILNSYGEIYNNLWHKKINLEIKKIKIRILKLFKMFDLVLKYRNGNSKKISSVEFDSIKDFLRIYK
ncbi:glycosyltransferase family 2 protein [Vibrio sp. 10N.222.49.C12]|uniref:glycosyltransferase family 2 protein n=1 Tax=Vibrio sp. 10N.222.49.C12 TaxID=3229614 RepID=UPI00354FAE33